MGAEYNGEATIEARLRARFDELDEFGAGSPVILDGAMGTELERRGVPASLPLWSTHALLEAPDVVRAIHADYAEAGAQILTANTFRTQRRTLARANMAERAKELTQLAVRLAREGAAEGAETSERTVWIAGSATTLEDCYRPDLVPDQASLEGEHAEHARGLADAGVDLILIETMNTVREALAAVRAATAVGLSFFVSFVCTPHGRLLSGEPLEDAMGALDALRGESPTCVMVNCLPPSAVTPCLPILSASRAHFGVYANLGAPGRGDAPRSDHCSPTQFAVYAEAWRAAGARVIGGCCGTEPAHIRALAGLAKSASIAGPSDRNSAQP